MAYATVFKLSVVSVCGFCSYYIVLLSGFLLIPVSAITQSPLRPTINSTTELKLQLVQVLFRHGDRNPVNPYPNDPYKNESYWPEGFSQLTKRGKLQQYELGVFIRNRYMNFLSKKYSPYEIHVEASDVDRTLMSAEANLAGIYPPNESGSEWKSDLDWQPIPVHTEPTKYDNKLKMNAPCPYYDSIYKDFLTNSEVMRQVNSDNEKLYEYLEKNAGRSIKSPEDVDFLYDTLHIESMYNFTLPNWTHSVFPEPMHNVTAFSFEMITYTTEMKRLKGGPLLKEMVQHMQEKVSKSLDERNKLFMYSAHDTTVSALLSAMQVFDRQTPPYASLVVVELLKSSDNFYYVQIYFRNDTTREPYLLTLPGCDPSCPFEKFVELTIPVIPNDWNQECQRGLNFSTISISALVLGGVLASMLLLSILSMAYLRHIRNNPNPPKYPYLHLQMEDEDA